MSLNYLAQQPLNIGQPFNGIGPLGNPTDAPSLFNDVITSAISLMTIVAGIWFIFLLISGAISWITSGGDKAQLEAARKRITSGLVGLVIVVAAIFIIELVGGLLGFENILDPGSYVEKLTPGG